MFKTIISIALFTTLMSSVAAQGEQGYPGAVKRVDLRLIDEVQYNANQPVRKTFADSEYSGWVSNDGNWFIKGNVVHTRLRCGTYQLGVQLGKGSPACLNVKWLSGVYYGTRREHCNSAVLVHQGGGEVEEIKLLVEQATCVRIVTKCTGVCEHPEK
jgi:hypothetical protein